MKKTTRFLFSIPIFLLLLGLILSPLQRTFARKSLTGAWDMTNKIAGFYNEAQDQFEVMFFGASHSYATFIPLELWDETGVKSYVFATQQQPLWATYTYIKEALKTQSPSLIVMDCRMCFSDEEYFNEKDTIGVTFSYMDDLPMSLNKAALAWESAPDMEGRVSALFNFMMYHSRWNDLQPEDSTFRPSQARDPYKGYVMLPPQDTPYPRTTIETITQAVPLLEKNQLWLEKIIRLCQDEGIALWLVKTPSNLEWTEKVKLNTVKATAEQFGVPFRDFNEEYEAIGLDENMFYDAHHLDVLGASRFTRYFAGVLMEEYPDLKKDRDDESWTADLTTYLAALEKFAHQ